MLKVYSCIIYRALEIISVTDTRNTLSELHKLSKDQSKLCCTMRANDYRHPVYEDSLLHVRQQTRCQLLHRLFQSTEALLPALLDLELLTDVA